VCDHAERAASLWELWEELSAHTISDADALPLSFINTIELEAKFSVVVSL
jgi:hypothetical protein